MLGQGWLKVKALKIQLILAKDDRVNVRFKLAINKNISAKARRILIRDKNKTVSDTARNNTRKPRYIKTIFK